MEQTPTDVFETTRINERIAMKEEYLPSEVHRTWNRPDAAELAQLYTMVSPNYRAVMESYQKAQSVARSQVDSATAAH